MNLKIARTMDYWFGIPLCFLLSLLNSLARSLAFEKKDTSHPNAVLFIKFSELGAIILSYPLIFQVRKKYPAAKLFFVTFHKNRDIFKCLQGIIPEANILTIREELPHFVVDTLAAMRRLRRLGIDIVLDLEFFSRYSAIFSSLVGASKRIGFSNYTLEGLYRGNLLTHKIQYNPLIHVAKNYLSFVQAVDQQIKKSPELKTAIDQRLVVFPDYVSNTSIKHQLIRKLQKHGLIPGQARLFLMNPGEGLLPLREWPLENFISLGKLILERQRIHIVLIGTEGVQAKAQAMVDALGLPCCIDLVGQTSLEELMELFSIADILISNDCGLAHLAMLADIMKFIIFGPESPEVFGPLKGDSTIIYSHWPCSPCLSAFNHRKSACRNNYCLKTINPRDVYDLIIKHAG